MPGVVALSSTYALTSVTNRYGIFIANNGLDHAVKNSNAIKHGVNTYKGKLVYEPVAQAHRIDYTPLGK
jgi:alanine dehydrogenase